MILVTGAGGFIGSHLVDRLLKENREVLAADVSSTPPPNISGWMGHPGFSYQRCDVRDASTLPPLFKASPEAVFHLAATVGVSSYISKPLETIDTIVGGTRNVLEASLRSNSRLVFLSTSEVYGRNPKVPWKENSDRVLGPPSVTRWTYSSSKGVCEHLVNAVHKTNGLPTTIIRPFNIYGPRQRPDFVVPATVRRVLRGERPQIFDSGGQTRCFTFIDDLIEGLWRTLRDEAAGETFNMGNQEEWTIEAVVKEVIKACGSSIEPIRVSMADTVGNEYEDVPRRVPDSSHAREVLGWVAATSVPQGVRATVEWARRNPAWLA